MSEILQDFSAPALIRAIEANQCELFKAFGHWPQAEVHDDPTMLWTLTDIPFPLFNTVLRAQLEPENVGPAIEAVKARCRKRKVPLLWWTGPATRPADLGRHLTVHGFVHDEDAPGMAIDLLTLDPHKLTSPALSIHPVRDRETLKTWSRIMTRGFGMPDFTAAAMTEFYVSLGFGESLQSQNYLGWLNAEPVATSSLFLGAGVAGIYNVATLPAARGQGIGDQMTYVPLWEAYARGYRVGILRSSHLGLNVYRRLGFQEFCTLSQYVWTREPT